MPGCGASSPGVRRRTVDCLPLHLSIDASKQHLADFRHRALRHHSEGIFLLETFVNATLMNSAGRVVSVSFIGEQHVLEDLGRIPTVAHWLAKHSARELDAGAWAGIGTVGHRNAGLPSCCATFASTAACPCGGLSLSTGRPLCGRSSSLGWTPAAACRR